MSNVIIHIIHERECNMSFRVKLISAALNIVCMLHTLLFPSTYVMWAMLPILITAASWIFVTERLENLFEHHLSMCSVIWGAVCIFLGLVGSVVTINDNESTVQYLFRFHKEMMILGGISIPFWTIALSCALFLMFLFVCELVKSYRIEKYSLPEDKQSLCLKIHNALGDNMP